MVKIMIYSWITAFIKMAKNGKTITKQHYIHEKLKHTKFGDLFPPASRGIQRQ
jgi:hypothetical protein